jgi:predicted DNA-binding ribbon-helix-helix protein
MSRTEDRIKAAQAESDAARDEPYPADAPEGQRPGRVQSVVQSVRLPADALADIEAIAARHDVPVGALIRGWVLAALAAERDQSLGDAIDQLVNDAERVRRLAGESPSS